MKEVTNINIEIAQNGLIVNYNGRNSEGDWDDIKLIFNTIESANSHIENVIKGCSVYSNDN